MANQSSTPGKRNDLAYWIIAAVLFFIFPPASILMIILRALGGNRSSKQVRGRHPYYTQNQAGPSAPVGARTTQAPQAPSPDVAVERLAALNKRGKTLLVVGACISAFSLFGSLAGISDALYWLVDGQFTWFLQDLLDLTPLFCFLFGGLGCLWVGLRKRREYKRFRSYLAMIGKKQSISISSLSSASGVPPQRLRQELEDMLDDGFFPRGFLDLSGDILYLTAEARVEPPPQQPGKHREESGENSVLSEIRAINDDIDNVKLSAQIDRIGLITAKIFDYQKSHPDKSPQLHSFLSYYLPTTLKILRAYAQLEDQDVSGENITAAMARIEGMMDKVVEGFEKQLDQLFQGDALDITSDVEVLERMLSKDGLSGQAQFEMKL